MELPTLLIRTPQGYLEVIVKNDFELHPVDDQNGIPFGHYDETDSKEYQGMAFDDQSEKAISSKATVLHNIQYLEAGNAKAIVISNISKDNKPSHTRRKTDNKLELTLYAVHYSCLQTVKKDYFVEEINR